MLSTGRARRVTVGVAALAAAGGLLGVVVASADDPPTSVVRSGADEAASMAESTTTTSSAAAPTSTVTAPAPTTTAPPRPSTTARPTPPTTTGARSPTATSTTTTTPPTPLDPAPPICAPGEARPPSSAALLGVMKADGIHEVALDGSADYLVPDTAPPTDWPPTMLAPTWTPDARRLAYGKPPSTRRTTNGNPAYDLFVADLHARCSTVLTASGQDSFDSVAWAPDGASIAYLRRIGGSFMSSVLETASRDGSSVTRIREGALEGVWAPDGSGRLAYAHEGSLKVRHADGREVIADPTRGGAEYASWSPDGRRLVYTRSTDQGVWVAEADGSHVRNLAPTDPSSGIFWSTWSPDGNQVAFVWGSDIWVVDADGTDARVVVKGGGGFAAARWSPDGRQLAYNGGGGVWVVGIDGTNPRLVVKSATLAAFFRRG